MASSRVNRIGDSSAPHRSPLWDWIDPRQVGWFRFLLVFVPVTIAAWLLQAPETLQFGLAAVAIIPLAGLIGEATESLADHLGPSVGSLLNATFGNAAELIIALFALFRGLDSVVKASLTGSVIGNLLLVLGASLLAGGIKYPIQRFNKTAAGTGGTMMVLAAIGLIIPAAFHQLVGSGAVKAEHDLSFAVSALLLVAYGLSLLFSLVTHKDLFNPQEEDKDESLHGAGRWGARQSTVVLCVATGFVAWMSEILVGAVEATSRSLGLTEVFVGVIVVAIVGNAAEHSTAVLMALKNQTDLAVGIALGSALQISLFVAPMLVFASYLRPHPMDLLFTPLEVVSIILAVMIARMVAEDGESNWLEGAMLLLIYAVLGMAFYFLPGSKQKAVEPRPTVASNSSIISGKQCEQLVEFGHVPTAARHYRIRLHPFGPTTAGPPPAAARDHPATPR